MTDNNDEKRARRPSDQIELKLTMMEASRRQLKALAAEAGCSMSNYVEAWISDQWKRSPTFQERMRREGRWWTDENFARHRPDGSLASEPTTDDQGGAR